MASGSLQCDSLSLLLESGPVEELSDAAWSCCVSFGYWDCGFTSLSTVRASKQFQEEPYTAIGSRSIFDSAT